MLQFFRVLPIALVALTALACQRAGQPGPTALSKAQEKEVGAHILAAPPPMQNKAATNFEDKVTLLGWDIVGTPEKGAKLHLILYWRCDQPLVGDWKMFVHLDWRGKPEDARENGDHFGVGDLYPVNQWKRGEIIKDEVLISVPAKWETGEATLFLGFFDPVVYAKSETNRRLKVTQPGALTVDPEGRAVLTIVPFAAPPPPEAKPTEPAPPPVH